MAIDSCGNFSLSRVNDSNVTLTLGGTPERALFMAASITAGWQGTLAPARGGLGVDASAANGVPLFTGGVVTFTPMSGGGGGSGDVVGPSGAVADRIATFNGTTGKIIKDGGATIASLAPTTYVDSQDALKAPIASPTFTGDPKAPTPTVGDNDTSIATTAFVTSAVAAVPAAPLPATALPIIDSVATLGTSTKFAREDHVHPSDTSRQPTDATLTALAGLDATAGLVEQTGIDIFAKRAMGVGATTSVLTRADGDARYTPATAAVRYDAAQSLTSAQAAQARANIWVTKKNYIINGGMMISQEWGTTAVGADGFYPVDQFALRALATTGVVNLAQVVVTSPAGSPNRLRATVITADATVGAGDAVFCQQHIEGLRVADLLWGTATAKTVTIQFGCKGPAGTYCVVAENGAANRSYVAEYAIAAGEANTDVVKSVTIAGDTAGTWLKDSGIGLRLRWSLMAGTTYQQAAGAWGTADAVGSASQFNFMASTSNIFELFDVSLVEGSVAPPFQVPDYPAELALCMRYWEKIGPQQQIFAANVTNASAYYKGTGFRVQKRAAPAMSGASAGNSGFPATAGTFTVDADLNGFMEARTANATAPGYFQTTVTANARL